MRTTTRLIAAILLAALATTVVAVVPAGAAAGPDEFEFLDLLNQERQAESLDPLEMVPGIHDLAEDWSVKMRDTNTLSHRPGNEQVNWIENEVAPDWRRIGENVGYGYSIGSLHQAFMDSPGHRANVLGDYNYVGVGAVVEPDGKIWVTFNFLKSPSDLQTTGVPPVEAAPPPPTLVDTTRLHPVRPTRLLDTRDGNAPKLAPGDTVSVPVTGRAGVPNDPSQVAAAALNVTAIYPDREGYVTAWASGTARPRSSNLNPQRPGQIIANQVVVPVGADGRVSLFTSTGTHLAVDIAGWYEPVAESSEGRFIDVSPSRLLDTRDGDAPRLARGTTTVLPVLGQGGVPTDGVSGVSVNVTLTQAEGQGYVTAWGDGGRPTASNVNTDTPGQTIANQVFVPVGEDGAIRLFNSMQVHLIVDITGYFTDETAPVDDAGLFVPVNPYRAVDTREYLVRSAVAATWDLDLQGQGWRAAALNVTIVDAAGLGYATVWGGGRRPPTSTVNADRRGLTIPNAATVNGAGDSEIRIYTNQETDVIIDVNGFYVR